MSHPHNRGRLADAVTYPFGRFVISYGTAELARKMGVSRWITWQWATRRLMPSLQQTIAIITIARSLGILLTLEQVRPPEVICAKRSPRHESAGGGDSPAVSDSASATAAGQTGGAL